MLNILSTKDLCKDKFGIPILPNDIIFESNKTMLNARIYLFSDITLGNEKYIEININNIRTENILPDFYYIKPDPKNLDPRNIENIEFVNEANTKKIRSGYLLVAKIPNDLQLLFNLSDLELKQMNLYGMRNHLHRPVNINNPAIVCAVFDEEHKQWNVRNFFELTSTSLKNI